MCLQADHASRLALMHSLLHSTKLNTCDPKWLSTSSPADQHPASAYFARGVEPGGDVHTEQLHDYTSAGVLVNELGTGIRFCVLPRYACMLHL